MSQRSYNHLALATSRSKSRTGLKESTPQTLCTNLTDGHISLSAKDILEQETRRSIERSLSVSQRRKNSSLY